MTPQQKSIRSKEIEQCVFIVSEHFNVSPSKVFSPSAYRGQSVKDARNVLFYYLHDQGLSFKQIAKLWTRSEDSVQRGARIGLIRMMGDDRAMIEALPRITSTLTLS